MSGPTEQEWEEGLVAEVGESIGYGRTMSLCEKLWNAKSVADGQRYGVAHATYCCTMFLVPCPGCPQAREKGEHCDWCCGAGRVTEKVAAAIRGGA